MDSQTWTSPVSPESSSVVSSPAVESLADVVPSVDVEPAGGVVVAPPLEVPPVDVSSMESVSDVVELVLSMSSN